MVSTGVTDSLQAELETNLSTSLLLPPPSSLQSLRESNIAGVDQRPLRASCLACQPLEFSYQILIHSWCLCLTSRGTLVPQYLTLPHLTLHIPTNTTDLTELAQLCATI